MKSKGMINTKIHTLQSRYFERFNRFKNDRLIFDYCEQCHYTSLQIWWFLEKHESKQLRETQIAICYQCGLSNERNNVIV